MCSENTPLNIWKKDIAITGISCRFPGAANYSAYWKNLREGISSVTEIPPERWDWRKYWGNPQTTPGKSFNNWGGFIQDIEYFDAGFFNLSGTELESMDPQQRIMLELVWACLEDAGIPPSSIADSNTGVYIGVFNFDYKELQEKEGRLNIEAHHSTGTAAALIPNRISYLFNLHGPSVPVDTACSSSLHAIHLAVQSLQLGECDHALAGGVNLLLTPTRHISFSKTGMLSPTGTSKSFDESADGYVRSEGAAVLLLKTLERAIADGDHIYGVIKGSAVNHGGKAPTLTYPNPHAQAAVIKQAIRNAGVDPASITFLEAHGTGTPKGDPIEIEGMKLAFDTASGGAGPASPYCGIGSAKSNIGHLEAAAGVAGVIKVLMSMQHRELPPLVHFHQLNPRIDLQGSPFYIVDHLQEWRHAEINEHRIPFRAGVSSFGFGGTNAHVVIEEAPLDTRLSPEYPAYLLVFSAKTKSALSRQLKQFADWVNEEKEAINLTDISTTLFTGREHFNIRAALLVHNKEDLLQLVEKVTADGQGDGYFLQHKNNIPLNNIEREQGDSLLFSFTAEPADSVDNYHGKLRALAEWYISGYTGNWNMIFYKGAGIRIGMPTYSFERERYWIPSISQTTDKTPNAPAINNDTLLPGLFMTASWQKKIPARSEHHYEKHLICLCDPAPGVRDYIATQMPAAELSTLSANAATIDLAFIEYSLGLFQIIAQLVKEKIKGKILIQVLIAGPLERSLMAGLGGLLKTAALEYPMVSGQILEIDGDAPQQSIVNMLRENAFQSADEHVRIAGGERWVKEWKQPLSKELNLAIPWKEEGVYLITGGAGELGLLLTKEILYRQPTATLILTGRSALSAKKEALIESLGHNVVYLQTDITDKEAVERLVQNVLDNYGQLLGIIHCAGIIRDNFIFRKKLSEVKEVLAPKVSGVMNLDHATANYPLDFFLLFSSVVGAMGNVGQSDYAMGNAFMDEFAFYRNTLIREGKRYGHTLSLNWGLWKDGGMQVDAVIEKNMMQTMGMTPLPGVNGIIALYKAMSLDADQVLIADGDPEGMKAKLFSRAHIFGREEEKSIDTHEAVSEVTTPLMSIADQLIIMASALLKINADNITDDANFSEFGFDSILYTSFAVNINEAWGLSLTPAIFFQYTTLQELAAYLVTTFPELFAAGAAAPDASIYVDHDDKNPPFSHTLVDTIAIIGISGCFPGAADIDHFWENLRAGKDSITTVPKGRWDWQAYYGNPATSPNTTNIKWGGFIDDMETFDARFFNISPKEATYMDPQHRLLLMYTWKVIEDAGYAPESLSGSQTGVFIGMTGHEYSTRLAKTDHVVQGYSSTGMIASVGPNRVSYYLNLHGPSEPVETACSSSLIAIHRAVEAIKSGSCDKALVGGVNIMLAPEMFMSFNKAGMLSEDGRCKTFSSEANGYVRGEGIGMLFLKKMEDAIRDGDHIYGVIRATAENHGGRANSLTAPNPNAQADLLVTAYRKAGIDPLSVGYIEAHGTGTELGDPIEVNALKQAFGELLKETGHEHITNNYCGLGSVKTNIGHLEFAAGVAGVIKVLLQLKYKKLVKSLHSEHINPYVRLENSPFYVVQQETEWPVIRDASGNELPRRAGISSFGFGGANAHVVMEEYQAPQRKGESGEEALSFVVLLSAKNAPCLRDQAIQLLDVFNKENFDVSALADIAYTLQTGRSEMEERLAIVADDITSLRSKLTSFITGEALQPAIFRGTVKKTIKKIPGIPTIPVSGRLKPDVTNMAKEWVNGTKVDWTLLHKGRRLRHVSLPTYPFAREHYSLFTAIAPVAPWKSLLNEVQMAPQHPLLHENTSSFSAYQFSTVFTGREFFLRDHVINGHRVLPGVAYLEMARVALLRLSGETDMSLGNVTFKNVVWLRPLVVDDIPIKVGIQLEKQDNDQFAYKVTSENDMNEVLVHGQGLIMLRHHEERDRINLEVVKQKVAQHTLSAQQCYDAFREAGLSYGPAHQSIRQLWTQGPSVLAELTLPESAVQEAVAYFLHPGLMDGALQTSIGLQADESFVIKPLLPFVLETAEIILPVNKAVWALVKYSKGSGPDDKVPKLDIDICLEDGTVCVHLGGYTGRLQSAGSLPIADNAVTISDVSDTSSSQQSRLIDDLTRHAAALLALPVTDIAPDISLEDYGFDSLLYTQFAGELNEAWQLRLTANIFFNYPTLQEIATYLIDHHADKVVIP